jgi:hypothetical protein
MHLRPLVSPRSGVLAALALVLGLCPADASQIAVQVRLQGGRPSQEVPVSLTATSGDGHHPSVKREMGLSTVEPVSVPFDLSDETDWIVTALAAGYWSAPQAPTADGILDLWPSGTIRGEAFLREKGAPAVGEVLLRFRTSPAEGSKSVSLQGSLTCPVKEGRWSCEVPAARLDFSVRVRGHVSQHRWGQVVPRGSTLSAGRMEFIPGASLIGWVETRDRAVSPAMCQLSLRPLAVVPSSKQEAAAQHWVTLSTTPNERGFFQFEAVPPGKYVVFAAAPGLSPVQDTVIIVEGAEAALKGHLILSKAETLEVFLSPPQDPSGRSWHVLLYAQRADHFDIAADSDAGLDGSWRMPGLTSGESFRVNVKTSDGELWYADSESFTLQSPPQRRLVELGVERVQGLVTLGKQPLAATLTFGAWHGLESTVVKSNETGRFEANLPRLGDWKVLVDSHSPPVRRVVEVNVARSTSDSGNNVEIRLPSDALEGEILDKEGNKVPKVLLTAARRLSTEVIQKDVDGGTFRLEGLADGDYEVRAEAARMNSEEYVVTVSEHEVDPGFLQIILRPQRAVRGRITSPSGSGAIGGAVQRLSPGAVPGMLGAPTSADADGRFSAYVSEALQEVCLAVFAPGFATRVVRLPVQDEEQQIPVVQDGGTLIINQPADPNAFLIRRPVLYKSGCVLFPGLLREKWNRGKDRTLITGAGVEGGDYSVCMLSFAEMNGYAGGKPGFPSCVHGTLQPFGTLTLKVQP